ncbi:MAG TPA: 2-hydroxyacid dehydrogenase [Bacteroidia bacterium]|nr:2-hydroxyacid dehydrogenase [Bacteroidia bacterium]
MKVAIYSFHKFEKEYFSNPEFSKHKLKYFETHLSFETAQLAQGCSAVSVFVSDDASSSVLDKLFELGIRFIALRSAGFNHVDIAKAKQLGMCVARVPDYSPYAVAEHAVALMLALNRKLMRAHNRVRELNFTLDGLVGFDMHDKTLGLIGTGKIGSVLAKIMNGFGCKIIATDLVENKELIEKYNVEYVDCETLCASSDIISLHLPLTPQTKHIINKKCIDKMKQGVMLINTSRGALINTQDVIDGLKSSRIGYLGIDVYEEEGGLFFEDHSEDILQDDVIARLMSFNNVLITSHQAFLTDTALKNIAATTIHNLDCFEKNIISENELK